MSCLCRLDTKGPWTKRLVQGVITFQFPSLSIGRVCVIFVFCLFFVILTVVVSFLSLAFCLSLWDSVCLCLHRSVYSKIVLLARRLRLLSLSSSDFDISWTVSASMAFRTRCTTCSFAITSMVTLERLNLMHKGLWPFRSCGGFGKFLKEPGAMQACS